MSRAREKEIRRWLAVAFPNFHEWKKHGNASRWFFQATGLAIRGSDNANHLTVHTAYTVHVGPATAEGLLDIALEIETKIRCDEGPPTPYSELFLVDPLQRLAALKENS